MGIADVYKRDKNISVNTAYSVSWFGIPQSRMESLKARMSSSSLVDGGGGRMRDKEGKEASKCVMTLPQWGTATD